MNTENRTLAARFFFKNCTVSIHLPGILSVEEPAKPGAGEFSINRDFVKISSRIEVFSQKSDFYRFLAATSSNNCSFNKKCAAIGYILCNKLPRNDRRSRAFLCLNEDKGAAQNGKSLFAFSISQLCNTVNIGGCSRHSLFEFDTVNEHTNLVTADLDKPSHCKQFYSLCTDSWRILRKCQDPLIIEYEKAPHLLLAANESVSQIRNDASFHRRFTVLEFSSFFSQDLKVYEYLGRCMFRDWDDTQWHLFDNFMFYCVCAYLHGYTFGFDLV